MLSRSTRPIPLWAWPTLLALDAPLVAVAWLLAFAHVRGVELAASAPLLLGATVWLVYTADRLLDSLRLGRGGAPTLRHAFAHARRSALAGAWIGVLLLALALALATLDRTTLGLGFALVGATGLYLLPLQLRSGGGAGARGRLRAALGRRGVQHLQVGLLFAAGVALFGWRALDASWSAPLLVFATLCSLNCAFVAAWERDRDDGRLPPAGPAPRRSAVALAAAALAGAAALGDPLMASAALSALLLVALDRGRPAIEPSLLRALADGALIAPLLLVPLW